MSKQKKGEKSRMEKEKRGKLGGGGGAGIEKKRGRQTGK